MPDARLWAIGSGALEHDILKDSRNSLLIPYTSTHVGNKRCRAGAGSLVFDSIFPRRYTVAHFHAFDSFLDIKAASSFHLTLRIRATVFALSILMNSQPPASFPAEESSAAQASEIPAASETQSTELPNVPVEPASGEPAVVEPAVVEPASGEKKRGDLSARMKTAFHSPPHSEAPRAKHEQPAVHTGDAVALAQPFPIALRNSLAFAFSAILSPYLVIPVGTFVIVASQPSKSRGQFLLWTALSILFSTVIPALYVVIQIMRGKITDVHVMEREQRGGPFLIAVVSSAIGAWILYHIGAPPQVWGIGAVLLFNGVVLSWITSFWKISMHVAVLSATVLAAIIMVPGVRWWSLVWMIPALMWARATRGRHSLWQGIAGCTVSCGVTGAVFYLVPRLWPLLKHTIERLT